MSFDILWARAANFRQAFRRLLPERLHRFPGVAEPAALMPDSSAAEKESRPLFSAAESRFDALFDGEVENAPESLFISDGRLDEVLGGGSGGAGSDDGGEGVFCPAEPSIGSSVTDAGGVPDDGGDGVPLPAFFW